MLKKIFTIGLVLAFLVVMVTSVLAAESDDTFGAYVSALAKSGAPEQCAEAGVDFGQVFIAPYAPEPPSPYILFGAAAIAFNYDMSRLNNIAVGLINSGWDLPGDWYGWGGEFCRDRLDCRLPFPEPR